MLELFYNKEGNFILDKHLHAAVGDVVWIITAVFSYYIETSFLVAILIGYATKCLAGIVKEIIDYYGFGNAELKDIYATCVPYGVVLLLKYFNKK